MKRVLISLIVLVVIAAGGWFGFNFYVQHRTTAEVEAAFERVRASGGKASHGKVAFDLGSRTLTIEDIVVEPNQPSKTGIAINGIKIASVKAAGVSQGQGRFSANSLDLSGAELTLEGAGPENMKIVYKVPQATVRDLSGPILAPHSQSFDSLIDAYRFALKQFAGVTASSIVAPSYTVAMTPGSGALGDGEVVYSGLEIRNVHQGKVDTVKLDRAVLTFNMRQPAQPGKLTGEMANINVLDFDSAAAVALLDPQKASDDSFHQVYRQITMGAFTMTPERGATLRIGRMAIDDVGLQPSKVQPFLTLALSNPSAFQAPVPSPDVVEKLLKLYEGMRVGKVELSDLSVDTPQGSGKLDTIRYDQSEFAFEGLDAPVPEGRIKTERFALKSLRVADLVHWSIQLASAKPTPSNDQMLGLLRALDGIEIKGVVVPYKNTKKLAKIDTFNLSWGQFVGVIPSKVNLVSKTAFPTDQELKPLLAAGIDTFALNTDFGAAWTEASGTIVLAPANIDIGNILKAQTRITLANVPRGVFSSDPAQVMGQAAQIEAGAVEFTLRDTGGLDLAVAEYARMQNIDRDAARRAIIDIVKGQGEGAPNPEAAAAIDAVAHFIETPGQTLVIKLTPLGKVPVMQLVQLMQTEPLVALTQFRIEASTTK